MFKSIVNAVINTESTAVKVVGYSILAVVGIGADAISAKKAEETKVAEAPAPTTEEVADEDILEEVVHDEDINEYDDSADRKAEDELFEAAIKSTSNSFVLACEEAIETKAHDEDAAVVMEEMAKSYLNYLQLSLGKEDECLAVHNAREALAAFRTFGASRIEWM